MSIDRTINIKITCIYTKIVLCLAGIFRTHSNIDQSRSEIALERKNKTNIYDSCVMITIYKSLPFVCKKNETKQKQTPKGSLAIPSSHQSAFV